jgi:hypothetical protein
MGAKRFVVSCAAALLLTTGVTSSHALVVIPDTADAFVRTDLGIRANDNYGLNQYLIVGTGREPGGEPDAMRSFIRFDLSSLSAPVGKAILAMNVATYDNGSPDAVYQVDVHRVPSAPPLTPWQEGNGYEGPNSSLIGAPPGAVGVDDAFGIAWSGAGDNPAADAANNTTQPPFDPERVATARVRQSTDGPGTVVKWDVTDLVNLWISGVPNEGIVLRDPTTDGTFRGVVFWSREGLLYDFPGAQPGPRLLVVPEPDNVVLLATIVVALTALSAMLKAHRLRNTPSAATEHDGREAGQ